MKKNKGHHGKGNRTAQRRRRKRHASFDVGNQLEYQLIDGNISKRPVAYCLHYDGWLSSALMELHRCDRRHCPKFEIPGDMENV